jgi:predicted Zn-dependent peptidase
MIEAVSEILHQHYSYLFQADLRMEILSEMNVDVILNYSRAFQRVREDTSLIEKGFRPVEYMKEDY